MKRFIKLMGSIITVSAILMASDKILLCAMASDIRQFPCESSQPLKGDRVTQRDGIWWGKGSGKTDWDGSEGGGCTPSNGSAEDSSSSHGGSGSTGDIPSGGSSEDGGNLPGNPGSTGDTPSGGSSEDGGNLPGDSGSTGDTPSGGSSEDGGNLPGDSGSNGDTPSGGSSEDGGNLPGDSGSTGDTPSGGSSEDSSGSHGSSGSSGNASSQDSAGDNTIPPDDSPDSGNTPDSTPENEAPPDGLPNDKDAVPEAPLLEENSNPNKIPLDLSSKESEQEYSFCGYYYNYCDHPLELLAGAEFDAAMELSDTVQLYVDGPEGHIDDYVSLDVEWDVSEVDFQEEGEYAITGILDTDSCPYPLDWADTPSPIIAVKVMAGGTLSFQPETEGSTLTLNYEMNGKPFLLPLSEMDLYESLDQGASWHNISRSKRVRIKQGKLTISGIHSDSMFQAAGMKLFDYYSSNSDIVAVEADGEIHATSIIPSCGLKGGEQWNTDCGSIWDDTPVTDGPYQILGYKTGQSRPMDLDLRVEKGNTSWLIRDFYNTITVIYGDEPNGFWEEKTLKPLPVLWDWDIVDAIDWNQTGKTVVHGHFSQETMDDNKSLLDFDHMPELSFTITVYSPESPLFLCPWEETLFKDNTVRFMFQGADDQPIPFESTSDLTVWCSVDGSETWYDITASPNVTLTPDSLTVSHLKRDHLKKLGYTFQIEQSSLLDHEPYSSSLNVSHDIFGVSFSSESGGERGGGKRYEKPPEGLFDTTFPESGAPKPEPEPPSVPDSPKPLPPDPNPQPPLHDSPPGKPDHDEGSGMPIPPELPPAKPSDTAGQGQPSLPAGAPLPPARSPREKTKPLEAKRDAPERAQAAMGKAPGIERESNETAPGLEESNETAPGLEESNETAPGLEESDETAPGLKESDKTVSGEAPASPGDMENPAVPPQPQSTWNKTSRVIASAAAVCTGGLAGFWMIRRR